MKPLNLFDRLVLHACKEHWCWRLYCTTCGSMAFRNGMEMIGKGKDPLRNPAELSQMGLLWHDDVSELAARSVPLGCQVITANIARYHHDHEGIDWLGFMGLALWRFEFLNTAGADQQFSQRLCNENRKLVLNLISNSWSEQFYSLLVRHSIRRNLDFRSRRIDEAIRVCKNIMRKERYPFQIGDLETMEGAILELNEYRREQTSTTQSLFANTP